MLLYLVIVYFSVVNGKSPIRVLCVGNLALQMLIYKKIGQVRDGRIFSVIILTIGCKY